MSGPANIPFLCAVFLGGLVVLFARRTWVIPVFLALVIFVSFAPKIMIFGQHFMIHRMLLMFGWARVFIRQEQRGFQFRALDKAVLAFYLWTLIGDTFLWGSLEQFVFQVANCVYDALGLYFLFRILIVNAEDIRRIIGSLACICVGLAGFMCAEYVTHYNWLSVLGQIQETVQVRHGRMRCQGAFGVPITAGAFGAILLPLFVGCWYQESRLKKWGLLGCVAATVVTVTAGSGGPLLAYVAVLAAWLLWPVRHRLRAIRWTIFAALLGLHLVMNAPVWALIARIKIIPGASSYHRYAILDTFYNHFADWWFLGVKSTESWGWLMDDVANQYCVVAKHGGLLALVLFLRVLFLAFRETGFRLRQAADDPPTQWLFWGFGVMLFAHCVAFVDVSYFDQIKVFWFLSLALVPSLGLLTEPAPTLAYEEVPEAVPDIAAQGNA